MKIREFILKTVETLKADGARVVYDGAGTMIVDINYLPVINYMIGKLCATGGVGWITACEHMRHKLGRNYNDIHNALYGGRRNARRTKWIRRLLRRAFGLPVYVHREPESHKRNRYVPEPEANAAARAAMQREFRAAWPELMGVEGTVTGRSYVPPASRPFTRTEITAWANQINNMMEGQIMGRATR